MRGYREALNLSYVLSSENSSESCDSQDDVETGAILVRKTPDHLSKQLCPFCVGLFVPFSED